MPESQADRDQKITKAIRRFLALAPQGGGRVNELAWVMGVMAGHHVDAADNKMKAVEDFVNAMGMVMDDLISLAPDSATKQLVRARTAALCAHRLGVYVKDDRGLAPLVKKLNADLVDVMSKSALLGPDGKALN